MRSLCKIGKGTFMQSLLDIIKGSCAKTILYGQYLQEKVRLRYQKDMHVPHKRPLLFQFSSENLPYPLFAKEGEFLPFVNGVRRNLVFSVHSIMD